jgi:hypothetical protein
METVRRSQRGVDYLAAVLREKPSVITRAIFWKIPRSNNGAIHLKLGRYARRPGAKEVVEVGTPKSELTLDDQELRALVAFLEENHEPFQIGARKWIALDRNVGTAEAEQLRALFANPDKKQLLDFLAEHEVIPDDVLRALEHRAKCEAVEKLERMLGQDRVEANWQEFFERHDWILGSDFVRILDERTID